MALFTTEFLKDRRLKATATHELKEIIQSAKAIDTENENSLEDRQLEDDILQAIREDLGFEYIEPYQVGALTDAPMFCDDVEEPTEVWAFMDYAVWSIPDVLLDRGYVIFEHSEVERKEKSTQ